MSRPKPIFAVLALCAALSACISDRSVESAPEGYKPNKPSRLVYGNYCGPGTKNGTLSSFPVDNLDAACREHDACYTEQKDHCYCDQILASAAREVAENPDSSKAKRAGAELVMKTFSTPFCKLFPQGISKPRDKEILKSRSVAPRNSTI